MALLRWTCTSKLSSRQFTYSILKRLSARCYSDDVDDLKVKHYNKAKPHPETPKPGEYSMNTHKGRVHDEKPFRIELVADKRYSWCTCGYSKNQPFCDGSHKALVRDKQVNVFFHPIRFKVEETKDYWLCNCKQTDNRPFCDGSHKKLVRGKAKK